MGAATKTQDTLEKPKINWMGKIWQLVLETKERMKEQGLTHPTIRTYWYRFWDTYNVIPGTDKTYKKLDDLMVKMRKAGAIEFGYFPVKRGESYGGDNISWSITEYLNYLKNRLLNADQDYCMPRWYGQPVILEVWVEKVGHGPQIRDWISDFNVRVRANQGYGTWEFIHSAMQELKKELKEAGVPKRVVILYLGDLDPSGTDIDRALEDAVRFFGIQPEFIRLALTPKQVKDYSLPDWPEKQETLKKIENDSRYGAYIEKFGKIACELDSFLDKAPEALRDLLRRHIETYFDEEPYIAMMLEEAARRVEIKKAVIELTASWKHDGEVE